MPGEGDTVTANDPTPRVLKLLFRGASIAIKACYSQRPDSEGTETGLAGACFQHFGSYSQRPDSEGTETGNSGDGQPGYGSYSQRPDSEGTESKEDEEIVLYSSELQPTTRLRGY